MLLKDKVLLMNSNNEKTILKNIEGLGCRYMSEHLTKWNEEKLQYDWWEAVKFFFSHSFMRGRRDELSNEYYCFTIDLLGKFFQIKATDLDTSYNNIKNYSSLLGSSQIKKFKSDNNISKKNSIKHSKFKRDIANNNKLIEALIEPSKTEVIWKEKNYKKEIHLGNDEDLMMVLDVLKFITDNDKQKNIYNFFKGLIKCYKINDAYKILNKIRAISDKISTLIIRDLLLMNPMLEIKDKDFEFAFPVDTWVCKIAQKLNIKTKNFEEIKKEFIKKSTEYKISPIKLAAGLWYLGFNSLDILLENCLSQITIKN